MTRLALLIAALVLPFQGFPAGQVILSVTCAADPDQSYALYLPSSYTPDRSWPVILAFDPGGRGRNPVERYQAAAEQYGFIVAGSNNSRNGSADTGRAVTAMAADVGTRFRVDARRVYTAGMSGGARVALAVALGSSTVAGVIASSAGYPDSKPRKTLSFPIFATAGTEDFNHLEMRLLDRELTTPHHLAIFEGGHVWLSSALAIEAVEWMELHAMKRGLTPQDPKKIDAIFTKRLAAADASVDEKTTFLALQSLATDFQGLRDVQAIADRAARLGQDRRVRDALKRDRDEDERELRLLVDVRTAESRLTSDDKREQALGELRRTWRDLAGRSKAPADSADRRFARRVLAALSAGVTTTDAEYLTIIGEYRTGRGGR